VVIQKNALITQQFRNANDLMNEPKPNQRKRSYFLMTRETATQSVVNPQSHWKPRFWLIFIGQSVSFAGSQITQFVLLWWIASNTGSTSALATAGIVGLLPQALLGPLGGVVADRFSRRLVMALSDAITALCMILLIFLFATNSIELWHIYVLMFVRSAMQAFQRPAFDASIPNLVPTDWIPKVSGISQGLMGIITIVAGPLGAAVLAFLPLQAALSLDVITAILAVSSLLVYAIPQPRETQNKSSSVWGDFKEGFSYVTRDSGLLSLYLLMAIVVFLVMQTNTLTPLLVTQQFAGGPNEIAFLQLMSGVGLMLGGGLSSVLPKRQPITTMIVFWAIACAAVALSAVAPTFWMAVVGWTVYGAGFSVANAKLFTLLATYIPNQIQGRVISLLTTMMGVTGPLGLLIAGPLGESIGVRGVFVWGGALSAAICFLWLFMPAIRKLEQKVIGVIKDSKETTPTR
jgi:MFS transporter, DHA3 family, macrolide efflux protein